MTNEEAIEVLKNDIEICTIQQKQACDMAIKALEQQPCEDCISRKAVEKLKKYCLSYDTNTTIPKADFFVKITDVRDLPPVKPQPKIDEIIKRIEETRDKDKLCEYPYNICINIIREVLGNEI